MEDEGHAKGVSKFFEGVPKHPLENTKNFKETGLRVSMDGSCRPVVGDAGGKWRLKCKSPGVLYTKLRNGESWSVSNKCGRRF